MAIALYARKSVERENSVSCETQLEYCRSMIRPEEKSEEILTFTDNGFSGGNLNRDGFQRMMDGIGRGEIRKLIVYRLDRISRSLSDFVGILETLKKYDVSFVSSQESFDTASPYGEMIVKLLMVFAEFERQSIISRVTQAYAHRSELGLFMGGKAPYGFTLTDAVIHGIPTKMLTPTDEIHQAAYIFRRYADSGMTLGRLVKDLRERGMMPSSGIWSAAKLSAILKNPVYVRADNCVYEYFRENGVQIVSGIEEFDGVHGLQMYSQSKSGGDPSAKKVVVMGHEGIVPSDIWLRCRNKLDQNRQFGKSVSNTTSWLGGMVICGECGRTMSVTKGGKRTDGSQTRYFVCPGRSDSCAGPSMTLYAESLEELADGLISEKLAGLKDCRWGASAGDPVQINLFRNRLEQIRADQEKLVELMIRDGMDQGILTLMNEKAERLAEEKRDLTERLRELEERESIGGGVLAERWKSISLDERRAVCRLLIHRIRIWKDGTAEVIWNL